MKKGWLFLIAVAIAAVGLGFPAGAAGSEMAQSTPVGSFPEWVNFYGINSTFNGEPLPAGSEVVAYSGSTRCGSFVVHTPGQYGLLPCYRNQADQPGAQPGDSIHFTVNGYEAILRGPDDAIWTGSGDRKHVELEAQGVPQTPTGTATQTTMPTSTPATVAPTLTPVPPVATATATFWVPPTPTATFWFQPAATPTPIPVAPPAQAGYCRDIISDGSFETGSGWSIDASLRVAMRSTAQSHTGSYAMRLGIVEESNTASPSAIRQRITIPADATHALLSLYYYPVSEPDRRNDYWEVLIYEPGTNNIITTLWRNPTGNERRWLPISFDLLAFKGRSFDLYLNLYNDGEGGSSALYVDDVVFQICTPTSPQPTTTPVIVTPAPTPATPWPTPSGACQELIVNGSFESGTDGWTLGRTERMAGLVADPRHNGSWAMHLGFTDGPNVMTFSSIRQTVTIPNDATSAQITFWTYRMSTATSGQDHQEFVILSPADNSTLDLPWREYYDNSRAWAQPPPVNLMDYRGQSIMVYFNAYNDGYGGSTAMVVDDISLLVCRPTPLPPSATAIALAPTTSAGTPTPTYVLPTGSPSATPNTAAGQSEPTPTSTVTFPTSTPEPEKWWSLEWNQSWTNVIIGVVICAVLAAIVIIVLSSTNGKDSQANRKRADEKKARKEERQQARDEKKAAKEGQEAEATDAYGNPVKPTRTTSTGQERRSSPNQRSDPYSMPADDPYGPYYDEGNEYDDELPHG